MDYSLLTDEEVCAERDAVIAEVQKRETARGLRNQALHLAMLAKSTGVPVTEANSIVASVLAEAYAAEVTP